MNKQDFQKQVKLSTLSGGCLNAHVNTSYGTLVDLLGEPNIKGDGYKTDAEWAVSFRGKIFSIYNYKDGKNYNGEEGLAKEDITDWHIGGNSKVIANRLKKLIESVV